MSLIRLQAVTCLFLTSCTLSKEADVQKNLARCWGIHLDKTAHTFSAYASPVTGIVIPSDKCGYGLLIDGGKAGNRVVFSEMERTADREVNGGVIIKFRPKALIDPGMLEVDDLQFVARLNKEDELLLEKKILSPSYN